MELDAIADLTPVVDENAVQQDLLAWLDGTTPPMHRPPWKITSLAAADWAMGVVADIHARVREYDDTISRWQAARSRVAAAGEWLEGQLKAWGVDQRTTKLKTVQLARGAVATRDVKPTIRVADEEAVIEWARKHAPGAIHTTERFNKSEVGAAWKIAEVVVGYDWTRPATGETEYHAAAKPAPYDQQAYQHLVDIEPNWHIEPRYEEMVLDGDDNPVPGVVVEPGYVSATVKPLG